MIPQLAGQNIVCFDCEIKEPIAGEVTWARHDLMGISVAVLYDWKNEEYKIYMDDNIDELAERLMLADLVTGFNIDGFDIPLVRATLNKREGEQPYELKAKTYDPLYWHRQYLGGSPYTKGLY